MTAEDFKEEEVLQAVVIADTFDKRLHPITLDTPKLLVPFVNRPLIEYVLEGLQFSGIQETFIFCCHQKNQVKEHFSDSKWTKDRRRMKVRLILSDNCDSVGDALRDISNRDLIRTDFVLLHGDTIFNANLLPAIKCHKKRKNKDKNITVTMILKDIGIDESRMEENVLVLQEQENRILNCMHIDKFGNNYMEFNEINAPLSVAKITILNTQISICSPIVLHLMVDNFDYQTVADLVKGILVNEEVLGNSIYFHMLNKNEYASRVTGFQSYGAVAMDLLSRWTYPMVLDNIHRISKEGTYVYKDNDIYLHESFENLKSIRLDKNVAIGKNTVVGSRTLISYSVIGNNCKIGKDVTIEGCFIFDNVVVEDGCKLSMCYIFNSAHIYENAVVPQGCVIGRDVKIFSTDSLSCNTRLVSSSMSDSFEALSEQKGAYIYFKGNLDNTKDNKNWDWGEIADESDASSFGESDAEDDEYDDSKMCYNEIIKNLKRSILENVSTQNVILEMNSAKHAYGIQIRELHILLMRALLDLPNKFESTGTGYFSRFKSRMDRFLPLLHHYIKSPEAEKDILTAMEEACEVEQDVLKSFVAIVKFLYDEDVLSENEIRRWWTDENTEHTPELDEKMVPFINWLDTADEDSDD